MVYIGTILKFCSRNSVTSEQQTSKIFSRKFNRTSPVLLIPLLSFLFITVTQKSPVLQPLLSAVYVCKEQLLRGTRRCAGRNTDLLSGRSVPWLMLSPNDCRQFHKCAWKKEWEESAMNSLFYYPAKLSTEANFQLQQSPWNNWRLSCTTALLTQTMRPWADTEYR